MADLTEVTEEEALALHIIGVPVYWTPGEGPNWYYNKLGERTTPSAINAMCMRFWDISKATFYIGEPPECP